MATLWRWVALTRQVNAPRLKDLTGEGFLLRLLCYYPPEFARVAQIL